MNARHAAPRVARPIFRGRFARTRVVLAAGCVLGIGATATLASWNDQEFATAQVTAGTFAIESQVQGSSWASHGTEASAVTLPLLAAGLKPGESKAAWVQFRTASGSVAGNLSLTGVALGTAPNPAVDPNLSFGNALTVRMGVVANTGGCGTALAGGTLVTGIGTLPTGVGPVALPANSANPVTLCVVVTLKPDAPNVAQGGSVTPTWTFTGTSN